MAELARAAGIARASLYRRFKRREDVVAALERSPESLVADEMRRTPHVRALDAFEAVARRKGIAATTLEDVAAEAGLGVATIYRHFGGREGLLAAYADERTPRAALARLGADTRRSPRDALRILAQASIDHLVAHGPLLMLGLSPDPEATRVVGQLRRLEASSRAALRAHFKRWIADGHLQGDAATLTNGFVGMVAGCVLLGQPGSAPSARLAETLVDLFLRGCAAPRRRRAVRKVGVR